MHKITLMVDKAGWPEPVWQARLAAFTELVGGVLLAIGLFSRLWGLGLAGVMVVAFYFTSLPALQAHGWSLFDLPIPDFNKLLAQAGLFVLAFGIFLTGAGPLSLDWLLFGSPREIVEVEEETKPRN